MKQSDVQLIPSICVLCKEPALYDSPADVFACCCACNHVVIFGDNLKAFPISEWRTVAESRGFRYGGAC